MAEAIPDAKLVYFRKSAHAPAEEMRELVSVLVNFLRSIDGTVKILDLSLMAKEYGKTVSW